VLTSSRPHSLHLTIIMIQDVSDLFINQKARFIFEDSVFLSLSDLCGETP